MDRQPIEFTNRQYRLMLQLIDLGSWILEADLDSDEQEAEIADLKQLLYSYNKDFGVSDLIEYDKELSRYFPSTEFESSTFQHVAAYDEQTSVDLIVYKLAERDLHHEGRGRPYPAKEDRQGANADLLLEYMEKYADEFKKHGLSNLHLKE